MKKKYWVAVCLFLPMLTACVGENKQKNQEAEVSSVRAEEAAPLADAEQTAEMTMKKGNHDYQVSIYRYPDKTLPLVVDELEQKFYDNSVEIKVLRDGQEFWTKKVTKDTFSEFLSPAEVKGSLLLGMNCDTVRSDKSTICFTAQVGQAGEGPAFLVLVPTNGSATCVQRDNQQEEIGYKEEE